MNYQGSKSRLAKYIVPIIQKAIDNNNIHYYLEPCAGGLNVIDKIKCDRKFAYDINKYLIYLYIHIKSGGKLPETVTKETYDKARAAWYNNNTNKEFEDWEIGCYGWLCSYNGRGYAGGWSYEGDEHRKDGTIIHRNYYQERKNNLLKQFEQSLCQDIMFGISDYKDLQCMSNYVIYVDPVYKNTKKMDYSQINYTEFWDKMREWSKDNIVFISELEAPSDFKVIWEHEVSRSINVKDKGKATEKLFVYKEGRQP